MFVKAVRVTQKNENAHLEVINLPGRGRDLVQKAIHSPIYVEAFPLFPDFLVWMQQEGYLEQEVHELSFGKNQQSVTIFKDILITQGDGDTNPKSLTTEQIKALTENLYLDGVKLVHKL